MNESCTIYPEIPQQGAVVQSESDGGVAIFTKDMEIAIGEFIFQTRE